MVERITAQQFHAAAGLEDWRVVFDGAKAYFSTGSFVTGAEFLDAIAELAEEANHHPDVDVRYRGVMVRLFTHEVLGLSERDVALARQISQAARELDIAADPSLVQTFQIAIDAQAIPEVRPFWCAVLGYDQLGEEDAVDRLGLGPNVWFQQMDAPRPQRNRIHVDVAVPRDQAEGRIAAALAAGGRIVSDEHAPRWWTLADPEGNEVDIAPWPDDIDE